MRQIAGIILLAGLIPATASFQDTDPDFRYYAPKWCTYRWSYSTGRRPFREYYCIRSYFRRRFE